MIRRKWLKKYLPGCANKALKSTARRREKFTGASKDADAGVQQVLAKPILTLFWGKFLLFRTLEPQWTWARDPDNHPASLKAGKASTVEFPSFLFLSLGSLFPFFLFSPLAEAEGRARHDGDVSAVCLHLTFLSGWSLFPRLSGLLSSCSLCSICALKPGFLRTFWCRGF